MSTFDESKIRRQGAGSAGGGQFAAKSNSRPEASLGFERAAVAAEQAPQAVPAKLAGMGEDDLTVEAMTGTWSREEQDFFANHESERVRGGIAGNENVDPELQKKLATDPSRRVRIGLAASLGVTAESLDTLRQDEDERVRDIAGRRQI